MVRLKNRWNVARAVVLGLGLLAGGVRADGPAVAGAKTQRLFWKVTSPTTEVYFLGSVHLATEDFYPLPAEIEGAFKQSDALLVEADVTKVNQADLMMMVMQQGMYGQGDTLEKHISPETMKALTAFGNDNGLPAALLGQMKPALVALTVDATLTEKMGMKPELGIDMHFLTEANEGKKKVEELESADGQLKIIMGMDDKLADKFLADTLKENSAADIEKVLKAWKAGDEKGIETLTVEDAKDDADKKINDLMLNDRNAEMLKKIEALLKGKEKVFVVVGAAHLVGEKGILQGLEKDQYKVVRPALTVPAATMPATQKN